MPVSVQLNTPLADALNSAIQPKLEQYGWATGGADDAALTEYIILMLVNGKTQEEVTRELSTDLLGLDPNDPGLLEFANWLFSTIDALSTQFGSGDAQAEAATGAAPAASGAPDEDQDMDMSTNDGVAEFNVPTGPKAMRNGPERGRGKRLVGQLNRAMDRTHENVLHRVRGATGNERINSHTRTPPTGPRMGTGRQPRGPNQRAANIAHGLASMNPMSNGPPGMNGGGMGPMNGWGMMPGQPPQSDLLQMMEVQQQMLNQMQQQLMMQQGGGAANGQGRGKSLFERTQHPNQRGNFRGRGGHHQNGGRNHTHQSETSKTDSAEQGEGDQDMSGAKREATNPEETVCRFNLSCTNKDCKFAHQSPAAPPGTTVDIQDVCSFGAACKNFKCVGRHPSPATRMAHQSEQDCKFWPNCQNARCPFKHPSKPPCRNGADCKTPGCEFYHNTVLCKFRPCTNRYCQFKHEEGQRGSFPDKVWTAEGTKEHVSERQFADAKAAEEQVIPGSGDDAMGGTEATVTG